MKFKTKGLLASLFIIAGALIFASCSKNDNSNTTPPLATSALYDTLGWFIQGGKGAVEGQGTKMVADPDKSGQKIQAGRLAIRTVVKKALGVIAADPKLANYFPTLLAEVGAGNTTGFNDLLENFSDFVQQAVSGQMIYMGKTMVEAHNHASYSRFGSTEHPTADAGDFDEFIADVVVAAQSLSVPNSVIGQLGTKLSSVKGDVVQDPS